VTLVDDFAANAAAVGFHVHRGEAPSIEGAGGLENRECSANRGRPRVAVRHHVIT